MPHNQTKLVIWLIANTPQIRKVKWGDHTGLTDAVLCLIHEGGTGPNFGMDARTRLKRDTKKSTQFENKCQRDRNPMKIRGEKDQNPMKTGVKEIELVSKEGVKKIYTTSKMGSKAPNMLTLVHI